MAENDRDQAAIDALARAFRRGWPARMIDKAAPGWAQLLLVALRADQQGGARDVAAALLDDKALASALANAGVEGDAETHRRIAGAILAELGRVPGADQHG